MASVAGRAWGWVRSWGGSSPTDTSAVMAEKQQRRAYWSASGWTSWIWGGWRRRSDHGEAVEVFWEAQEKLQPVEIEDLGAGKQETDTMVQVSRWWSKYLPTSSFWSRRTEPGGLRKRKGDDTDGNFSDFETPPPSPPPLSPLTSPFRLFACSWMVDILPEHYDICFNFLRHLFDLFVVAFLWTVSPPTKLILEVLGVQGALRLWFHGMAMFFVSTVGMAGLLWLIQEYLPQFALIYGIVQALVISVSVRQSVILGVDDDKDEEEEKEADEIRDSKEHKDKLVSM